MQESYTTQPAEAQSLMSSFWTPEREAMLRSLWRQGLSCSVIARRLGAPSKNAIIGKVNRLGLPMRARAGGLKAKAKGSTRPQATADELQAWRQHIRACRPRTIFELRDGMCRMIIADGCPETQLYCAQPTVPTKSWCPDCYERVFDRAPLRRLRAA